ncbi:MAG: hypothetical protein NT166_22595 [Candidatus Aminicenantes bacterium]|nr:hypothetical protein [Candidatus Aminicenantes bacterium]
MNALKPRIPSIHRVMFRVIHLNGLQAREVMDRTGAFPDEAIKKDILNQFYPADTELGKVTGDKLEVEPALFSLLCSQVYEKGVGLLTRQTRDDILSGFLDQILGELPRSGELTEWIESHLITEGGFRTPYYLEHGFELRETVKAATDKKLLRILHIGEKEHVEIIHDVLAPVIKERRNRRLEEKKRLGMEKELRRQQAEMEKELRQKRMKIGIISITAIISTYLTIFVFIQKNRADEQYRNAVSLRLASEFSRVFPLNNVKAIRIAEAAYKIGNPNPEPAVIRVLSEAAYSTRKRPFYTADFKGHTGAIYSAVVSPDGNRILTASADNTAKLWDLKGNILADFNGYIDVVRIAMFFPDGKQIKTVSTDGTAIIWPTPEGIMDWLKTAPIPKLTQEEKEELGIADFDL